MMEAGGKVCVGRGEAIPGPAAKSAQRQRARLRSHSAPNLLHDTPPLLLPLPKYTLPSTSIHRQQQHPTLSHNLPQTTHQHR